MTTDMKKILAILMAVTLLGACAAQTSKNNAYNTDRNSSGNTPAVTTSGNAGAEGSLRLNGGNIQVQNADGTWSVFCSAEDLQSAISASKTDTNQTVLPAATAPTTVIQGPRGYAGPAGQKGDTGATGATGAAGKDGKDGKNGTQVTIDAEGQLMLDGIGTGYYLIKKDSGDKEKIDAPKNLRVESGGYQWNIFWEYDYLVAYNEVVIDGSSYFGNYNGVYSVKYEDYDVGTHSITVKAYPFSDKLAPNSTTSSFVVKRDIGIPYGYWRQEYDSTEKKTTYFICWKEAEFAANYTVNFNGIVEKTVTGAEVEVATDLEPGTYTFTITTNPIDPNLYNGSVYEGRLEIIPPSPDICPPNYSWKDGTCVFDFEPEPEPQPDPQPESDPGSESYSSIGSGD